VAIGGDGDIERFAGDSAQAGELLDQFDKAVAEEGFAPGEADLLNAEADEEFDKAEVFVDGELRVLSAVFAGTTVDALVVAAVGDGDTEIVDDPAVAVGEAARR